MLDFKPISIPLLIGTSLTTHDGIASINATTYCQVLGGLQHLQITRPNISSVVTKLSPFMHVPFEHHLGAVKRLLHYLNSTRSLGIQLLVDTLQTLHSFSDVDWAGNPDERTSTSAFLIFLDANPIS